MLNKDQLNKFFGTANSTPSTDMNINDLPLEMFDCIIKQLKFDDILVAMDVCEDWNQQISNSTIWSEIPLLYQMESRNYLEIMQKLSTNPDVIKRMIIRGIESKWSIKSMFSTFTNLTVLELIMCKMDTEMMAMLNELSSLTTLHIVNCYRYGRSIEFDWDLNFKKLPKLKSLCLSDFGLSNDNYHTLHSCEGLHHLDIKKIKNISQKNVISLVKHFKNNLTSLSIYGDEVNDQGMLYISECNKLSTLCILRCEKVTDKGMFYIKKLNLSRLMLWNNSICTQGGLKNLFLNDSLVNLKRLSFSKILNLTKSVVEVVSVKCPKLEFFGLYLCPMLGIEMPKEEDLTPLFPNAKLFYVTHLHG